MRMIVLGAFIVAAIGFMGANSSATAIKGAVISSDGGLLHQAAAKKKKSVRKGAKKRTPGKKKDGDAPPPREPGSETVPDILRSPAPIR
jgi:hypothetical protein